MRKRLKILLFIGVLAIIASSSLVLIPHYFGSVVYPLDYRAQIKASGAEFNVNPNFIAGVIFTESHFNANAHSGAGAMGLMQLMPSTAASIAQSLHDSGYTGPSSLSDPARNIRYGTFYLRSGLDRYKGNEDFVLMHYNGGPGAVISYQRGTGLSRETAGYVQKVKSARDMYNQIYGEWWNRPEFNKPTPQPVFAPITNILDFWRTLISSGGNQP